MRYSRFLNCGVGRHNFFDDSPTSTSCSRLLWGRLFKEVFIGVEIQGNSVNPRLVASLNG